MPSREALERFIARVEENAHAEAVEEFYTENATMQENQDEPRVGRELHVDAEHKVMANAKAMESTCLRPVFVEGDHVVIRWRFRFVWRNDTVTEIEELAYQRWEGDRIAEEQFFFDPAQRAPRPIEA
ncbi:MAG: nuclear transport factor 2 family protein [Acidobacteriota bacterium]